MNYDRTFRNDFNNMGFIATKAELENLWARDWKIHEQPPTRDRKAVWNTYIDLYINYCKIVEKLGIIFDEMAHVQRRPAVQMIFDAANMRLLEIKEYIVDLDLCEISYLDDMLVTFKFIPQDIDIVTPAHISRESRALFLQDLFDKINLGERIYTAPIEEVEEEEEPEEVVVEQPKKRVILEDDEDEEPEQIVYLPHENPNYPPEKRAALLKIYLFNQLIESIQTAERARFDRIIFNEVSHRNFIIKTGKRYPKPPPLETQNQTATVIQKVWRGYKCRKDLQFEEVNRKFTIGMYIESWHSRAEKDKLKALKEKKRAARMKNVRKIEDFAGKEKIRLLAVRGDSLFEDISDEIREWFREWYDVTGSWDNFPEVEEGGTILIVKGETQTIDEWKMEDAHKKWLAERYAASPELKKKDADEAKAKKAAEKERIKQEKIRKKEEAEAEAKDPNPRWFFEHSEGLKAICESNWNYHNIWAFENPLENPEDQFVRNLVTEDRLLELSLEIRGEVDELMRLELQVLRDALNRDRVKAKLPPLKAPKKKKKKKKKGPKDLTASSTVEELFQELVDEGIIHSYPEASLEDFIGDYNFSAFDLREQVFDPAPCLKDSIHAVILYCILPLASSLAKRAKGVMITGPKGNGKKLLVNAILNHTGAVLFDLTPANTVGKYPGKKGQKRLMHLISKMSKILQPSVIFMDGAEKPFYKKVPPDEARNDTKMFKSALYSQIIKNFKPDEKVMVISTSNEPWNAKQGPMLKCYTRIILVPRLDYGSTVRLWQVALMKYHSVDRDFDCSALAMVTQGYSYNYLTSCLNKLMTPERIIRLRFDPLKPEEVLNSVLADGGVQISLAEYNATFIKWYNETPLAAKRQIRIADLQKEIALLAKAAAKTKKKK